VYLKRLEVQGFKSFVTRTVFEFGPGITAVVGPNGSGKSNISDAIRWVLGEQSARVLRLRRAEDALYAGGGKRAPAGMAEASLCLDNTEGWLPIAYDEVVVTRRLHRSGDSEYLINRQRVRLRDVNDLFARARVGQNSYALMGQGLVDQVLSLRPEERRRLLEEAADVRRHQMRIEEAQGRLAATRENLAKVDLIIAEIAPRLGQLERAARRAQDHARLVEELAEAQNAWYSLQWQQRSEALVAARALYDQRNAEFTSALAEADQLDARLDAVLRRTAERQAEVTRLDEHLRELREQARAADQRRTLEAERLGFVQRRLDDLRAEIGDLSRERDDLSRALTDQNGDDLSGALSEARAAVETLVQELDAAQTTFGHARRSLADAERAQRRASSDLQEIDDAVSRLDREDSAAQQTAEQLDERRAAQLARLKQIGRESLELRRVTVTAAREVERADAARRDALDRLDKARDAASAASQTVEVLRNAVEEQTRRYAMLERLRDQTRGINRAAQVVLDAASDAERPERPRVVGLLADLLRVTPGMEQAIEAALADYLTAVVVERGRDAMLALDLLAERAAGRAVVAPLDAARAIPPLHLARERGVRGVASDFVRCDPQVRTLVDALLGRVIVVDDMEIGKVMLQRGMGTVVTVGGTVLRPVGAIVGGHAPADSSLFALERELESAAAEIERLLAEQEAHHATATALAARVREVEPWVQTAAERVARAEREYAQAHTRMLALRGHLAPVRGELSYIRTTLRQEDARRPMRAAERASLMLRRSRAELALRDARTAVQQARRAVDASAPHREALSARLTEARAAVSALERDHATRAERLRSRRTALERIEERIHARRREAEARIGEIDTVETDRLELGEALRSLTAQIEITEAALRAAREHLASTLRERAELEPEQSRKRAQVTELERHALAAENDVHRRAQDLDRLREEMIEEGFAFESDSSSGLAMHSLRRVDDSPLGPRRLEPVVTETIAVLDAAALQERVRSLRARVRNLGGVNTQAPREFDEAKQRHDFLSAQAADLCEAEIGLREAIAGLRGTIREQFRATFERVNLDFARYFKAFFGGGSAHLVLSEPEDEGESGIDIVARPPGKRLQSLTLLSGGERSMTAVALLFALLESNPAPFCVLDEVDAALDEANVNRFGQALKDLATRTQFVVITHNRGTIQSADTIYGVSMNTDGASSVLSLRLADVPE
jgi:chromosome segregation protein